MHNNLVIFIMGPTASGKTQLAMNLFDYYKDKFILVSVDSALIYKGMDIGSAKPTKEELLKYPHHLIDIINPQESYSAGNFFKDVTKIIDKSHLENKIPILVGGTMLYFRTLLGHFNNLPSSTNESRSWLNQQIQQYSNEELHQLLKEIDYSAYLRLHPNDIQRVGRVLEIFYLTGKSLTELSKDIKIENNYKILQFSLDCIDRSLLHKRIEDRFHLMIKNGFVEEVYELYKDKSLNINLPSIRCVGYKQIWEYLDNKVTLEEAIFNGICATRQLAKRQITWLNNWQDQPLYKLSIEQPLDSIQQNNLTKILQKLDDYNI